MSKTQTITVAADTLSAAMSAVLTDLGLPATVKSRALNTLARTIATDGKTNWGGLKAKGHFVETGLSIDALAQALRSAQAPRFEAHDFMTDAGGVRVTNGDDIAPYMRRFTLPNGAVYVADPFTFLRSKADNPMSAWTLALFMTHTQAPEDVCHQYIQEARRWLRSWMPTSKACAELKRAIRATTPILCERLEDQTGLSVSPMSDLDPVWDVMLSRAMLTIDLIAADRNIERDGLLWLQDAVEEDKALMSIGVSALREFFSAGHRGAEPKIARPIWDEHAAPPMIGWQIEHEETSLHWNDRPSFEVIGHLTVAHAELRAAQAADVNYRMIPIYFGEIEEPHLSW